MQEQEIRAVKAMRSIAMIGAITLLAVQLSGCAGVLIGAGATAGVAASEERGLEGAVDDLKIRTEINHLWFQHNVDMYSAVTLTINEGRVLLTGTVPTAEARIDAVRLTWQASGVKEVINEIQVNGQSGGFLDYSRDVLISQKLKSRLLFDKEVRNINYTVDVNDAVIYLMGVAQDQTELDRVIAHARDITNVRGVVSHVRLKSDPRRFQ
jgi:osmotically-inducible protein OsmY